MGTRLDCGLFFFFRLLLLLSIGVDDEDDRNRDQECDQVIPSVRCRIQPVPRKKKGFDDELFYQAIPFIEERWDRGTCDILKFVCLFEKIGAFPKRIKSYLQGETYTLEYLFVRKPCRDQDYYKT